MRQSAVGPPPMPPPPASNTSETIGDRPAPVASGGAAPRGRSATAKLLELKRALDTCTKPEGVDATLESWATTLGKLPERGAEMALGYARFVRHRLATGEAIEDAGAARLNELAKE